MRETPGDADIEVENENEKENEVENEHENEVGMGMDVDIKVIDFQSHIKGSGSRKDKKTEILRPFRKGERRIATMNSKWDNNVNSDLISSTSQQMCILRQIADSTGSGVPGAGQFHSRQISRKLSGYYAQDVKKGFFDADSAITLEQTVDLLLQANLLCFYCREPVKFIYETVRDPRQWTLERIHNQCPHTATNVVLACLQCNLKRRVQHSEKFAQSKQMTQVFKLETGTVVAESDPGAGAVVGTEESTT
jgi:hypothetical protein